MSKLLGAVKLEAVLRSALDFYYPENFQDLVGSLDSKKLIYEDLLKRSDLSVYRVMEDIFDRDCCIRLRHYHDDSFGLYLDLTSDYGCAGRSSLCFSAYFTLDDLEVKK